MTARIAHIIDTLEVGGAQKLAVTFASAMRARDVELTVISLRHDPSTPIPGELRAAGARLVTFPAPALLDPRRLWQLIRYLRRERFQVLHAHLTFAIILGAITGRVAGIPVVATLHTSQQDPRYYHRVRSTLETLSLRYGARAVIAVGDVVARANESRLGHQRVVVVPNAVAAIAPLAPAERDALRTELAGDPARPILISVGRLAPPKGYNDLLDAVAALRTRHPSALLLIVGQGALREQLEQRIHALALGNTVRLPGQRDDVARLLGASDLYVSSSHWEGLPVSILEAMAAGLPVVATAVGDIPGVVVDAVGVIVPPHQPKRLCQAIADYLDDPERLQRDGEAGRRHVATHYGLDAWIDQIFDVYDRAGARTGMPHQREGVA